MLKRILTPITGLLALLLALSGMALAQATGPLTLAQFGFLAELASSPVVLGLAVFGFVSTIKRDAERRQPPIVWNPWLWRGVAAGIGLILALILHAVTGLAALYYAGWSGAVVFGLVAAVVAVIGRDGLKSVTGWIGEWAGQKQAEPAQQPAVIGEVQPPADLKSPPPSGIEAIPGRELGLFNVASFTGAGGAVAGLLGPQGIDMLVETLLKAAGLQGTPLQMFRVGAKLAMVAPDLLDGDVHLSSENLANLNNVILDLKAAGGLT